MAFQQPGQANQTSSPPPESGVSPPRGTKILVLVDLVAGIWVAVSGIQGLVSPVGAGLTASEWYAVGAIFTILGLLSVAAGYGLWKAKPWAWLLGLWAGAVFVVLGALGLWPLILVGTGSLIFYYFNRADLKRYLGKVRQ